MSEKGSIIVKERGYDMCGIMGYMGFRDSKEVLLNGLEKIQYRGYDSMGLVVATKNGFKRIRSVGDIKQLRKKVVSTGDISHSSYGLAHSRWATHGAPSEANAHPHKAEHIYIVHNGIIENAQELKKTLPYFFSSETDSEVIAYSLLDLYKKTGSLKEALFDTFSKIKGEYACAVMSEKHPKEFFAFKKGPSLLIGVGEREIFLCSDAQGILPYTNKIFFLKDGEVAHIKDGKELSFYSSENSEKKIKKNITTLKSQEDRTDKQGHPHYMLKEIYEQPGCVSRLIQQNINNKNHLVKINEGGKYNLLDQIVQEGRLSIVACGSSYYSALYGKYTIEQLSRIAVEVDMASEFRYRAPVLPDRTPIMLISQSGETADTLAVLKMAKELNWPVLSLCNVEHSSLDRGSTTQLYMCSGVEKGVASTKAFVSTLTMLFLLALFLGRQNKYINSSTEKKYIQSLLTLPSLMEEVLSCEREYTALAHLAKPLKSFIYLGRNIYYPLALEGALKMKELTYKHGSAYPAGEMKHGPLALVDKDMLVVGIAPKSSVRQKTLTNLEEVRSRGGKLIVLGTQGDKEVKGLAKHFLSVPACNEYLSAILCALPLQLMAYRTACTLGHNVDQPRNLAKSVTVE